MKNLQTLKTLSLLIIMAFFLSSCDNGFMEKIDHGTVSNGVYHNQYLKMTMSIPQDWALKTQENYQELVKEGSDTMIGDDTIGKAKLKVSLNRTVGLITLFRYADDIADEEGYFNYSLLCSAEYFSPPIYVQNKTEHYLKQLKHFLQVSKMRFSFEKPSYPTSFGGKEFGVLPVTSEVNGFTVNQDYLATHIKGAALACIITYMSPEEKKELMQILASMEFKG